MKDPHVHVEKTPMPGFGHMAIRTPITNAVGLVPDLPKTVGTGCGGAPPAKAKRQGQRDKGSAPAAT